MPAHANSETRSSPAQRPNLLLVDDHHSNLVALQSVLSEREYNLLFAHSGAEALELAAKHDIALVLLDVQMPEMDGFETARRLKEMEGCREIPIVFITAIYKEDPFVKRGYEAGAVDYFSKPFDPDVLRLKVRLYSALHQKTHLLREREKRLRQTEELLQVGRKLSGVLETLPVGVLIADAQGRVCQVNQEVSRIWGCAEPADTDTYGDFLGWWGEDGQLIKAADGPMARVLAGGGASRNELTHIKCLDGTSKIVLNSASPLFSLDKEIVGVVVVIQDVTEHKQIEQDVQQRIEKLISAGVELEESARRVN
jgi:two-component system, sporulation sensor kinase E